MVTNTNIIKTKFDSGMILVTEHSPSLPSYSSERLRQLILYLDFISARSIRDWDEGWRAVSASFTGFEITVEMESFETDQAAFFPIYLIQTTQIAYPEVSLNQFMERLKMPLLEFGWKELATSKLLTSDLWSAHVITLWTKESYSMPGSEQI